jgi:hypothetical protein
VLQCISRHVFLLGKTNALRIKIFGFLQLTDETITDAWKHLKDYIATCPHHSMEDWFIIQSFYHGLIRSVRLHIDVVVGGCFFALNIEEAHKLVSPHFPSFPSTIFIFISTAAP